MTNLRHTGGDRARATGGDRAPAMSRTLEISIKIFYSVVVMNTRQLSELEQEVMNIVWELDECSVRDVLEKVNKNKHLAYTTVMTIMGRLRNKGLLLRKPEGLRYLYHPKVSQERFIEKSVHHIFKKAISTLGGEAVAHFVKEIQKLNPQKRQELLKILDER